MPAGRPSEGIESLPDKWYDDVLSLYSEGGSDVEVKALIYSWRGTFSNDLWNRWLLDEEEFSQTIKNGRLLAESWWNKNGRTNLQNRDFNYTGWYMQMKNRFGWSDKQEIDNKSSDGSMSPKPTSIVFTKGLKGGK